MVLAAVFRLGRLDEAEALSTALVAEFPDAPDVLNARAFCLAQRGLQDEALECLEKATGLRPLYPSAQANLLRLLRRRNDPSPRYLVTIITPTLGLPVLARALQSVQQQDYPWLEHYVVGDGPEATDRVASLLPSTPLHPLRLLTLPVNVGGGGYCGHRAYAAVPYLVEGRYICFLDEDNWFEPNHVSSLMARITREGLAWAYSLRNIVDRDGRFLMRDDCQSLGRYPTWNNANIHLVDTNCYMLRRDVAISTSQTWYRRYGDGSNPDFTLCSRLSKEAPHYAGNGLYTVNYRLGSTTLTANADFFRRGNAVMQQRFPDGFPWLATSPEVGRQDIPDEDGISSPFDL
jgi:hypothetical protein